MKSSGRDFSPVSKCSNLPWHFNGWLCYILWHKRKKVGRAKMIIYEFKARAKSEQYKAIDEAVRTSQFIHWECLRDWMDNKGVSKYDLEEGVRRQQFWRQNQCSWGFKPQPIADTAGDGGDLYPNWLPARSQLRGACAQKILLTPDSVLLTSSRRLLINIARY